MKKLGIMGSFGSGNLGDEAAWMTVKQFFERRVPQYKYETEIFQWGIPYLPFSQNIHCLALLTPNEMEWINNSFSAIIVTGGGIIGNKFGLVNMPGFQNLIEKITVPIYSISVSAEDVEYTEEQKGLIMKFIKRCEMFTVRDTLSQDSIYKMTDIKMEITPDIVTAMVPDNLPLESPKLTSDVVMTTAAQCYDKPFAKFWLGLGKTFMHKFDNVPMHPHCNDIMIAQATSQKAVVTFLHPKDMLNRLHQKKIKFVIAGRLHSAVLAAMTGTPFFAINYHPKVKAFCDSIGWEHYYPKNPTKIDSLGYGYDHSEFNYMEASVDIGDLFHNMEIPKVEKTAKEILQTVFDGIQNLERRKEVCMYCGHEFFVSKTEKIFKCPDCENVNQ